MSGRHPRTIGILVYDRCDLLDVGSPYEASGLSLGRHLVDRLKGRGTALATARQFEHPFDPEGRDGFPASGPGSTP